MNPQLSKKQTKTAIQMQTWLFLMKKKGLLRRNPSAKKVESGPAENYSQGAGLDPYQKTDHMCLTGFQNCCDPVVAMSLLFFPFWTEGSAPVVLCLSTLFVGSVESRKHVRSSQVFRSRETYSRSCSWGITGTLYSEEPHLHQDLIYTRSTMSQWCTGMRILGPLGGGEHIWHAGELDKICVLKVDHGRLKKVVNSLFLLSLSCGIYFPSFWIWVGLTFFFL